MRSRGRRSPLFAIGFAALTALLVAPAVYALSTRTALIPAAAIARRVVAPADNQHHLYVLDGHGVVHPVGDSPALTVSTTWPNKDVAYSLALFTDGTGGYVLNAWAASTRW